MDTLSLVSEYLKDLEECIDDGDSKVAKEEKLFDALEHKSVVIEEDNQKIVIFTKAPLWAFGEQFMRYSLPCKVDGQGAWDAELDLADSANYVTEKVLENMGFVRVNFSDYGRKMVNDVNVEIHGVNFKADFVVLDYVNKGEPSIVFGRDFLATTKSQFDFGLGEIRMNLTKFKEGIDVIYLLEEVGSSSGEVVKMGKANRNKGYNINKLTPHPSLRLEEIPPNSAIPPQLIYYPLTLNQKEKMKEALDIKYKELEESKPILEVLENYVIYKKKLDEILIGKERLNKKEFSEEDKINGVVEMVALVDTGVSVSVLPYSLYKDLGLGDLRPYQTNLTMTDNTQAKAMGEVKNPRTKTYFEAFEMEGEDDWLGSFEVGRDEGGNVKYGPVAPSFIDIEDDMERALAMEAYFNPFKNKVDGDGDWHAMFEIVTPSGRKFNRAFKTKTTTRKLSGKFKTEDVLRERAIEDRAERQTCCDGRLGGFCPSFKIRKDTLPNPLIAEYERRNKRNTITYSLQPVLNANLKWRDLLSVEIHGYCEKLSKLQERSFGVPRVANRHLFDGYCFEDTLREMMKLEYIYEGDGDVFVDYSWERALSIDNEIYHEWVLEFFSTLYFDKDVDRNNLIKEKCIWFRLYGHEHILTLPKFTVVLGLFIEDEVEHRLFEVYFGKLEVDDKQFDHKDYWTRVGKPILTNHKEVLVKEPLMRIVHKVIVGYLVHRVASRERCQKRDLWMMSALEESRRVNLAWIIADHLYKHAPRTKKNNDEIKKCSEPIDCEYWTSKMLADELDEENTCLKKETGIPT
ncbi:retrovirus-related pol polyprotein from transposon TNT 1-94 [Tanacetum coccineum]|uniref:Retrovirus-related pol polyprotein from transposon TNT 1-94 n=1 Tax=Tanacetum coccineum TaxID=301880 RepID=A0ABQ5BYE8_9ASTR